MKKAVKNKENPSKAATARMHQLLDLWRHREFLPGADGPPRQREAVQMAAAYGCGAPDASITEVVSRLLAATDEVEPEPIDPVELQEIADDSLELAAQHAARVGLTPAESFDFARLLAAARLGTRARHPEVVAEWLLTVDRLVRDGHETQFNPGLN